MRPYRKRKWFCFKRNNSSLTYIKVYFMIQQTSVWIYPSILLSLQGSRTYTLWPARISRDDMEASSIELISCLLASSCISRRNSLGCALRMCSQSGVLLFNFLSVLSLPVSHLDWLTFFWVLRLQSCPGYALIGFVD